MIGCRLLKVHPSVPKRSVVSELIEYIPIPKSIFNNGVVVPGLLVGLALHAAALPNICASLYEALAITM